MNVNFKTSTTAYEDPYFNNVSLLLHMDGTNGSTNFIDSSLNNFTMLGSGNAQISDTVKKFGNGSAYFNGDSYIVGPNDPTLSFGTEDFTIESWIYITGSNNNDNTIVCRHSYGDAPSWLLQILNQNIRFVIQDVFFVSNQSVPLNTWTHIAVTRQTDTLRLFINGSMDITGFNNTLIPSNFRLTIGGDNTGNPDSYFYGYIDELRITKGVARYTGSFTPPSTEFLNTPILKSLRFLKSNDGKKTLMRPINLPSSSSSPSSFTTLVDLGSNSSTVDSGSYIFGNESTQDSTTTNINSTYDLGSNIAWVFNAPENWSAYSNFGLRISVIGTNPNMPFTLAFFNSAFAISHTYSGSTAGVGSTPSIINLNLDVIDINDLNDVFAIQLTTTEAGTINVTFHDVVGY